MHRCLSRTLRFEWRSSRRMRAAPSPLKLRRASLLARRSLGEGGPPDLGFTRDRQHQVPREIALALMNAVRTERCFWETSRWINMTQIRSSLLARGRAGSNRAVLTTTRWSAHGTSRAFAAVQQ
jgi:hypothetical protein